MPSRRDKPAKHRQVTSASVRGRLFFAACIAYLDGCGIPAPDGYWTTCNDTGACPEGLECARVVRTTSLVCTLACTDDADCPWEMGIGASDCVEGFCNQREESL